MSFNFQSLQVAEFYNKNIADNLILSEYHLSDGNPHAASNLLATVQDTVSTLKAIFDVSTHDISIIEKQQRALLKRVTSPELSQNKTMQPQVIKGQDVHPRHMVDLAPVGIQNRGGHDCWANAALQLIAGSPSIASKILKNKDNPACRELVPLIQNYYEAQQNAQLEAHYVDSSLLREWCPNINNSTRYQNDPFDALADVFEAIDFDYKFTQENIFTASDGEKIPMKLDQIQPEPMVSLNLQNGERDFKALLDQFFNDSRQDLDLGEVTRHFKFQKAPEELVIQAKRFGRNDFDSGYKIGADIDNIPEEFTLDPNNVEGSQSVSYEISGCIIHEGKLDKGHFVTLERKPNGWYLINDLAVSMISDQKAKALLKQGYIFSYRKKEDKPSFMLNQSEYFTDLAVRILKNANWDLVMTLSLVAVDLLL